MIDKLKRTFQEATEMLKDQAANLGEGAKERTYKLIDEWLQIFPKLEIYGLEITSFSLSVAISPSLEVELTGKHEDFTPEKLEEILKEDGKNAAMFSVFNTIRMTYSLHRKVYAALKEPLIVKIKLRISPEIKVFIGEPIIQ